MTATVCCLRTRFLQPFEPQPCACVVLAALNTMLSSTFLRLSPVSIGLPLGQGSSVSWKELRSTAISPENAKGKTSNSNVWLTKPSGKPGAPSTQLVSNVAFGYFFRCPVFHDEEVVPWKQSATGSFFFYLAAPSSEKSRRKKTNDVANIFFLFDFPRVQPPFFPMFCQSPAEKF